VKAPTPPKHVDRFLSIGEAEQLVASITKPDMERPPKRRDEAFPRVPDMGSRLFVQLMLDAGLRWQEAAGLHVFRVDLMRRQIRVQEVARRDRSIKLIPKSEAGGRVVPLTDDLVTLLSAHLKGKPREGLVFPGEKAGQAMDARNWLKRVWAPALAAAGLRDPQPTPHDCRHSYGSWLADQGVEPHHIAKLMGHGSLRAVERYIHSSEARMDRARDALGARRAHGPESQSKRPRLPGAGNGA
jgi:integrase